MVWSGRQLSTVWRLAGEQHGVVGRRQLLALGLTKRAIEHRIAIGRLHPVREGVYAVGRPGLPRHGDWMAAVLSLGPEAALSHASAAALWGIGDAADGEIEISIRVASARRAKGVRVHRRPQMPESDITTHSGIPVTGVVRTLLDLAIRLDPPAIERMVNEADKLRLVGTERLRRELESRRGQRGAAVLRSVLDRRTFRLTDSELERRFLALLGKAGLPLPLTRQRLNGFRVDFYWPDLGLVVETDGLTCHRTPAQQARDRVRDQAHTAAGRRRSASLTPRCASKPST